MTPTFKMHATIAMGASSTMFGTPAMRSWSSEYGWSIASAGGEWYAASRSRTGLNQTWAARSWSRASERSHL